MLKLGKANFMVIKAMKKFGLLTDLEEEKLLDLIDPTVFILCSDGAQKKTSTIM